MIVFVVYFILVFLYIFGIAKVKKHKISVKIVNFCNFRARRTFWFPTSTTTSSSCGCPSSSSSPVSFSWTLCSWGTARFSCPSKSTRRFAIIRCSRRWAAISPSRARFRSCCEAHRGCSIGRSEKCATGRGKGSWRATNMSSSNSMAVKKATKIRIRRHSTTSWSSKVQSRR